MNTDESVRIGEASIKDAYALLERDYARIKRAIGVIDEGIWEWDVGAGRIWFSPRWKGMLGYEPEEMENTFLAWQNLIHPEDLSRFLAAWVDCEEGRVDHFRVDYRIRRKTGDYQWVEVHGTGVREADGVKNLAGCHTDISVRKACEESQAAGRKTLVEEVSRRTQELELLRELGEAIVSELELDKVLRLVASKARSLIGAETLLVPLLSATQDTYQYMAADGLYAEDIEGSSFSVRVGMCGWVLQHEKPLLYGDPQEWVMDEKTRWENGQQSALLVPLFSKGRIIGGLSGMGKSGGGSFTSRDMELLTIFANQVSIAIENASLFQELRQMVNTLEQRVAGRTAELEAINQELEAFSYSVSHDLRAPLRSIDGFGLALLEDYGAVLEGDGKVYLERLRANTQRMGELIDAMLQLCRVVRAGMKVETVDLSAMADEIAAGLVEMDGTRQVEFACEKGITVQGDPRLLRVALENLLSNAWKYSTRTEHPRVEFGALRSDSGITCFVRDNGAGFDMTYVDKLFNAFQRLHSSAEFAGTGIGLATVRRIVQRHGGRVWAEGAPGMGATFYFSLK